MQEDAFIVIPPGIRHSPRQPSDPGNVVLAIALEPCTGKSGYYHTFRKALSEGGCRAVPLEKAQAKRIKQLFTVMESSGLRDSCLRQALAYEMVFTVLDRLQGIWISEEIQETGQPEEKTNITLDWMVNDMRLSLSDIAGEMGYTTRHTARLIRQQYGMSLGDIRRNRILTTAKRLLLQYPEVSLNQIAVQAGFPSGDSMKRAFLKWENNTPAEYREKFLQRR
ncbi:MAG: AraC family transcriptional regulator [Clostridia bacterium]|nr:AraC family transcriptional regulator [Clostridia bacterium]